MVAGTWRISATIENAMNLALYRFRKLVGVLCLLAVLISALTPATSGGLLFAILIPLWLFLAAIVTVQVRITDECFDLPLLPNLPVFSSRPPPAR
jgi:hypothetical protein